MPRRKPFQYDTLLRVRKRQEDIRAQALAAALRDQHAAEHRRAEITRDQVRALERASETASQEFTASDVRRFFQYERHLAHLATQTDAAIRELRGEAGKRRAELEEAMKRRRILERLEERQQGAFLAELNKEEQAMGDEVATNYAAIARSRARKASTGETAATERGAP